MRPAGEAMPPSWPRSGLPFVTAPNKFAALAGHEPLTTLPAR
jgi:fumarate hydratase class II